MPTYRRIRSPEDEARERCAAPPRELAPAIVCAIINVVQSVSFGLLLLPPDTHRAFDDAGGIAVTSYVLTVLASQAALAALAPVPFLVGGGAFELLPLLHSLAAGLARSPLMADATDDELVATTLAGYGLVSGVIALWYLVASSLRLSKLFRMMPLVALKVRECSIRSPRRHGPARNKPPGVVLPLRHGWASRGGEAATVTRSRV